MNTIAFEFNNEDILEKVFTYINALLEECPILQEKYKATTNNQTIEISSNKVQIMEMFFDWYQFVKYPIPMRNITPEYYYSSISKIIIF